MLWDGPETGTPIAARREPVMNWSTTSASKAYERIVTGRVAASRSRRDADLAEARHRDTQVSGMIDDVGRVYRWR